MSDEVDAYFEERPISCKENPLAWWKSNNSRFPRLSSLAKHFWQYQQPLHPLRWFSQLQVV